MSSPEVLQLHVSDLGDTITAHANAHTKGSWSQLTNSSSSDIYGLVVVMPFVATNVLFLLDIGTGAATSETVVIPNIMVQGARVSLTRTGLAQAVVPLFIPSGTRIAARVQAGTAGSQIISLCVWGLIRPTTVKKPVGAATTYGVNTGTTRGTAITPHATANTKGSWTELSASCAKTGWLWVCCGGALTDFAAATSYAVDIGIGAAGAESLVVPNLRLAVTDITNDMLLPWSMCIPVQLDAGTRIAARCAANAASQPAIDVSLVTIDAEVVPYGPLVGGTGKLVG